MSLSEFEVSKERKNLESYAPNALEAIKTRRFKKFTVQAFLKWEPSKKIVKVSKSPSALSKVVVTTRLTKHFRAKRGKEVLADLLNNFMVKKGGLAEWDSAWLSESIIPRPL